MNNPGRSLANEKWGWLAAPLLLASLALLFWLDYAFIYRLKPPASDDFTVFWAGSRTVLLGGNPYDHSSAGFYNQLRVAASGDSSYTDYFLSPILLTLILMPLGALPIDIADALWTLISQVLLGFSVVLVIKGAGLEATAGKILVGVGMALLWRYVFLVMFIGNLSLLLLFAIVASWYCTISRRPYLAGAAAALLLIKPQVTFLIVPLLLVLPIAGAEGGPPDYKGRASVRWLIGFGLVTLILLSYSFAVLPDWIGQWLQTLFGSNQAYFNNQDINSQLTSLRSLVAAFVTNPSLVQPVAILLSVPLWLGGLWLWWRFRNDPTATPYLLGLTISLNILTCPYIRDYDSTILLFGLLFCFFTLQGFEKMKFYRGKVSWLCWGLAFLPYPVHFLALATSYAVENLITLLYTLVVALAWAASRKHNSKKTLIPGQLKA